jgi:hypothetical protein
MFTTAMGLRGQAKQQESVPTKTLWLAALLATLFLMSVAVNALIVVADSNVRARSAAAGSCSILETADRLACYDKRASPSQPHPFRGATAPALNASL